MWVQFLSLLFLAYCQNRPSALRVGCVCPPAQFHTPANKYEEARSKRKAKNGSSKNQRAGSLHRPTRKGSGGTGHFSQSFFTCPWPSAVHFRGFVQSPGQITVAALSGTAQTSVTWLCVRAHLVAATRAAPLPVTSAVCGTLFLIVNYNVLYSRSRKTQEKRSAA